MVNVIKATLLAVMTFSGTISHAALTGGATTGTWGVNASEYITSNQNHVTEFESNGNDHKIVVERSDKASYDKFSTKLTYVINSIKVDGVWLDLPYKTRIQARIQSAKDYYENATSYHVYGKLIQAAIVYAENNPDVPTKAFEVTVRDRGHHLHVFARDYNGKIAGIDSEDRSIFFKRITNPKSHDKLATIAVQQAVKIIRGER